MEQQGFRYKRVVVALLALAVVLLALIMLINYLPTAPGSFGGVQDNYTLDGTATDVHTYAVAEGQARLTVNLDMAVSAGSVTWMLNDPGGVTRWNGTVAAGQTFSEARVFDPAPGTWQWVVEGQEAAGDYVILWHVEN